MAMAGLREVLVYAENEGKTVTVSAGSTVARGKVARVNPLVIQPTDRGAVTVFDFDAIQSVSIEEATVEEIVQACQPQRETRFTGRRPL